MEVKKYGPLDFIAISDKVKIIDEEGVEQEDVELHAFVQSRGVKIVDNLRERFKTNWNELNGKEETFFKEPMNVMVAQSLLRQYAIILLVIEKVESVVKDFKEKLKTYDESAQKRVVKAAPVMKKSDVERIIQEYAQFAATIRDTYLTEGKTSLIITSVQTSTRLVDRHKWLKAALEKWEKSQKK